MSSSSASNKDVLRVFGPRKMKIDTGPSRETLRKLKRLRQRTKLEKQRDKAVEKLRRMNEEDEQQQRVRANPFTLEACRTAQTVQQMAVEAKAHLDAFSETSRTMTEQARAAKSVVHAFREACSATRTLLQKAKQAESEEATRMAVSGMREEDNARRQRQQRAVVRIQLGDGVCLELKGDEYEIEQDERLLILRYLEGVVGDEADYQTVAETRAHALGREVRRMREGRTEQSKEAFKDGIMGTYRHFEEEVPVFHADGTLIAMELNDDPVKESYEKGGEYRAEFAWFFAPGPRCLYDQAALIEWHNEMVAKGVAHPLRRKVRRVRLDEGVYVELEEGDRDEWVSDDELIGYYLDGVVGVLHAAQNTSVAADKAEAVGDEERRKRQGETVGMTYMSCGVVRYYIYSLKAMNVTLYNYRDAAGVSTRNRRRQDGRGVVQATADDQGVYRRQALPGDVPRLLRKRRDDPRRTLLVPGRRLN